MVKTFIRKPLQVRALQWTGENINEIQDFCPDAFVEDSKLEIPVIGEDGVFCFGFAGSYVVKFPNGSFSISTKDDFEGAFMELDDRSYATNGSFY